MAPEIPGGGFLHGSVPQTQRAPAASLRRGWTSAHWPCGVRHAPRPDLSGVCAPPAERRGGPRGLQDHPCPGATRLLGCELTFRVRRQAGEARGSPWGCGVRGCEQERTPCQGEPACAAGLERGPDGGAHRSEGPGCLHVNTAALLQSEGRASPPLCPAWPPAGGTGLPASAGRSCPCGGPWPAATSWPARSSPCST